MCVEIYMLDPAYFPSTPGLAWQAALKNDTVKLDVLTDIAMLLMVKKFSEFEIWFCSLIFRS